MSKKRDSPKKHTRRVALKYLGRIGAGTTLWGAGGNFLGRVVDYAVTPAKTISRLNPFSGETSSGKSGASSTRRGFLSSLTKFVYDHPVASGTVSGATYGSSKSALRGRSKYLTEKKIAKLEGENEDYRERLSALEGRLEGIESSGSSGKAFLIIGSFGLLGSLILGSMIMTGNTIGSLGDKSSFLAIALFIVSLALVLKGVSSR